MAARRPAQAVERALVAGRARVGRRVRACARRIACDGCTLREGRMMLAPATMDTTSTNHKPTQEATARRRKPQPASTTTCEHPGARPTDTSSVGAPFPCSFSSRGEGVGTPAPQRTGMPRHKSKRARTWVAEPHNDVPTTPAEPHATAYPRRRGWWSSCTRRTRRSPRRTPRCRLHSANDSRTPTWSPIHGANCTQPPNEVLCIWGYKNKGIWADLIRKHFSPAASVCCPRLVLLDIKLKRFFRRVEGCKE